MTDRLLTTAQAADRLSLSVATIRRMCTRGEIRHVKLGAGQKRKFFRIPESVINDLIESAEARAQENPQLDVVAGKINPPGYN